MNSLNLIQLELRVLVIFLCKAPPENEWNKTAAADHADGPVCPYNKVAAGWLVPASHRLGAQARRPKVGPGLTHRLGAGRAPERLPAFTHGSASSNGGLRTAGRLTCCFSPNAGLQGTGGSCITCPIAGSGFLHCHLPFLREPHQPSFPPPREEAQPSLLTGGAPRSLQRTVGDGRCGNSPGNGNHFLLCLWQQEACFTWVASHPADLLLSTVLVA